MDYRQIQEFIKELAHSGAAEVEVETKDLKIKVKTHGRSKTTKTTDTEDTYQQVSSTYQPSVQEPAPVVQKTVEQKSETKPAATNIKYIKSPMVGTFYRRPSPDKANFASVGDEVRSGQVICIIEAMKLFNEIESEISGKVVEILVEDATPVEYDQPLIAVEVK